MKKIVTILMMACAACFASFAQKAVIVSGAEPYMEWLGGRPEVDTHDMRLCISFDEDAGTLSVSLFSTNSNLFGFKRNVLYDNVFCGVRKLRFDKLPYKVDFDPSTVLRMSGPVKRLFKPNAKNHNFHPWLEYDGLEAMTAVDAFPSDSLVQVFKLEPSAKKVMIRLKDIFILERKGSAGKQWNKLYMNYYQSLGNEYDISVRRDPCRNLVNVVDSVKALHRTLSSACEKLVSSFPGGKAKTLEELENFQLLRNSLLRIHSKMDTRTGCLALAKELISYNACVDSVINMTCSIADEYKAEVIMQIGTGTERIDADGLLYYARRIDELVAEWQIEKNRTARLSIIQQCDKLIDKGTAMAIGRKVVTDADRKALDVFAKAVEFYKKVCR